MIDHYTVLPSGLLWRVVDALGNQLRIGSRAECVRFAEMIGVAYQVLG